MDRPDVLYKMQTGDSPPCEKPVYICRECDGSIKDQEEFCRRPVGRGTSILCMVCAKEWFESLIGTAYMDDKLEWYIA